MNSITLQIAQRLCKNCETFVSFGRCRPVDNFTPFDQLEARYEGFLLANDNCVMAMRVDSLS